MNFNLATSESCKKSHTCTACVCCIEELRHRKCGGIIAKPFLQGLVIKTSHSIQTYQKPNSGIQIDHVPDYISIDRSFLNLFLCRNIIEGPENIICFCRKVAALLVLA